jgi:hypothetical protein
VARTVNSTRDHTQDGGNMVGISLNVSLLEGYQTPMSTCNLIMDEHPFKDLIFREATLNAS